MWRWVVDDRLSTFSLTNRIRGETTSLTQLSLNAGACIYCGDTESPLTREHILPRGLGGNSAPEGLHDALVLQNATCDRCRRITSKIEEECLRPMMDYARARLGLKRKDRSAAKMEMLVDLPDGSTERRDVDSGNVLGPIIIPCYYEAGALTNKPHTDDTAPCDYHMIVVAPAHGEILKESTRVGVSLTANSKIFAQMLAKIALGLAVARFGVTGFEPTVRNFILNNPNEYGHWVGGFAGTPKAAVPSSKFHRMHLQTKQVGARTLIIVEIQLFAEFGGPTNYVIVGRPL